VTTVCGSGAAEDDGGFHGGFADGDAHAAMFNDLSSIVKARRKEGKGRGEAPTSRSFDAEQCSLARPSRLVTRCCFVSSRSRGAGP
jgi:hypothetical protein